MKIRKLIPVILMIAAVCLALAACMNNDDAGLQTTPRPTGSFLPDVNGADGAANNGNNGTAGNVVNNGAANGVNAGDTSNTADGALNPFDWANGAADIETAIGQISEIAEARVVVTGSTALVGVKFDNAYKGQLTERIREMVASEVLKADPSIKTVAVTSSAEDVEKVYALSDQVRAGRTADELSADINEIVRSATTLR